jgi:hypothetical protein
MAAQLCSKREHSLKITLVLSSYIEPVEMCSYDLKATAREIEQDWLALASALPVPNRIKWKVSRSADP